MLETALKDFYHGIVSIEDRLVRINEYVVEDRLRSGFILVYYIKVV